MSALRTAPAAIRLALAALALLLTAYAAQIVFAFLPAPFGDQFLKFASNLIFFGSALVCGLRALRGPDERAAWLLIGLGLLSWSLGLLYYTLVQWDLEVIPIPSLADAGYLLIYPPVYAALVLLYRSRMRGRSRALWIDGAIGALAAGAIGAAIVFDAVLESAAGSALGVATNLSYPLADVLMLGLVVGVLAMTGWRKAGAWAWIAGGLAMFAVSDSLYFYGIAVGSYEAGVIYDAGWPTAAALLAFGAWTPAKRSRSEPGEDRHGILFPITFAAASLGLLIYDHFEPTNVLALGLASACLVAVLARLAITFGENRRMLTTSREEACTDSLTGLGNRRSLTRDLERVAAEATAEHPVCLALFDLDGFKSYNDTYGHPAGDSLLARLGGALHDGVESHGSAYRMGGDEFCVLIDRDLVEMAAVLAVAATALSEHGDGFSVSCSYGRVMLPAEARDAERALHLADERMYQQKNGGRVSAGRQSSDVLLRALSERHPSLGDHVHGVAELALAIGERLGQSPEELADLRQAAELHDMGKVAIPDAILDKPGPLDDAEWEFMRRHTIIGERILQAAPALKRVATIVRSTHERMDGTGYPDQLAGEAIPLAARIVLVCDAYEAMTADRSYRKAMSDEVAIEELQRCSGAQFDPRVVTAFRELAAERAAAATRL
ncbi:MAG TPA: diguanylate cyclase [Solirubrobacteraceae bacterium]|nr:diguanylate cyclase [Solirubrobacteraceae bacterium]